MKILICSQRRPSSWGNDAFPLFHISPLFPKFFSGLRKISPIWPFPTKLNFPIFIHQNFWRPFFISHWPKISNFPPISPVSIHFPSVSGNLSIPHFCKISPDFVKLTCFYIPYVYLVSPYFYHDAFMHHTMNVLDAPVCSKSCTCTRGIGLYNNYMHLV